MILDRKVHLIGTLNLPRGQSTRISAHSSTARCKLPEQLVRKALMWPLSLSVSVLVSTDLTASRWVATGSGWGWGGGRDEEGSSNLLGFSSEMDTTYHLAQ